ncbi:pyridoxal phosphate-dependent aminotransferase [Acetonema longum]|uniref:Aminotransferase class I and II n=1 Tax=Acetonema longum DSM 6540 TaxID=1009370 RepID=F7NDG4_9FIRM|nr:aminotransferase class I/II-fold pyridoxal phosphate-dependent enzyme [Acetonema longum]EGO65917.1 aminotransferase class I and II [Acetonema longum DSM 6540]
MTMSMAASHAKGKFATDNIFDANAAAVKAAVQFGKDKVTNATIGALLDDNEVLVCLPTVEKVLRNLPVEELINYAPIAGLPDYLDAVIDLAVDIHRPEAYIKAIATSGGSGVIHHTIWNYTEIGDTVLTTDWFWGPYRVLCQDALRKLDTFTMFDEQQHFNMVSFQEKVTALLAKQDSLVIILNSPAHNPTGYSLSDAEWAQVLNLCKEIAQDKSKKIILDVDIAYLDFAGEKAASRSFMKQFGGLPENILVILGYSMSKSFTAYGQRVGAMIGVSSSKDVIDEFVNINQYSSRATWSNINRGAMRMLATIYKDKSLLAQVDAERNRGYQMIQERAGIFTREAKAANLKMLPFFGGYFLTIPVNNPAAVCDKLHEDNIFAVPLAQGIRIAVCAVTSRKITGMAAAVAKAKAAVD